MYKRKQIYNPSSKEKKYLVVNPWTFRYYNQSKKNVKHKAANKDIFTDLIKHMAITYDNI